MATAQNFIPNEAEIEVNPAIFRTNIKNLASDEEISNHTLQCVQEYEARYIGQRDEYDRDTDGIWNLQDAMWRCGLNDAAIQAEKRHGANEPDEWERARVGSTLFYRQVRQKSSNGYAVQTSRDMPFKYEPVSDSEVEAPEHAEARAKRLNLLAKWSMKNDNFNVKSINFWNHVYKRGNTPVMVEWIQEIGKKTVSRPIFADDGITIEDYEIVEYDGTIVNRPTFKVLQVESLFADTAIGCIQDQECVIVTSVISMTDIVAGITNGFYREDLLENIGTSHQWDGSSGGHDNKDSYNENRGIDQDSQNSGTGQYLKREVFVNLPVDEENETWDIYKNVPKRFRVTLIGNTVSSCLVARIERNSEPDDAIPIELIHANPDDDDYLYHISDYEVVRSNIAVETTILRQMIDNNTLVNKPPIKEVDGAVRGNNRAFGPDARWKMDDLNAIDTFDIRPLAQENMLVLEYIKDDSNTANSIDKNMIGESFGARTTASEATTISGNSRRPNIVNIEYILEQLFQFLAKRYKVNWEAYGRHDQIIQITDENDERVFIKPEGLGGEYDIIIDVVDDMKDDEVKAQRIINGAQAVAQIPEMAQQFDWKALAEDYAEFIFGSSKYVKGDAEGDAIMNAQKNIQLMLNNGVPLTGMTPNMNLKKHLAIYKEERKRWNGYEEQNPNVALLDSAIEQLEEAVSGQGQGGSPQAQGLPQSQAQLQQQLTSGALGGVQ